jgi:hypothetical protein
VVKLRSLYSRRIGIGLGEEEAEELLFFEGVEGKKKDYLLFKLL